MMFNNRMKPRELLTENCYWSFVYSEVFHFKKVLCKLGLTELAQKSPKFFVHPVFLPGDCKALSTSFDCLKQSYISTILFLFWP